MSKKPSKAGKQLPPSSRQAAVDAELAKFDAQWNKTHKPLPTINLDAHGEQYGDVAVTPETPGGVTVTQWRDSLRKKIDARREFIHNNQVIQEQLAGELEEKVVAIKKDEKMKITAATLLMRAVNSLQKRLRRNG